MSFTQVKRAFQVVDWKDVDRYKWKRCDQYILLMEKLPTAETTEDRKHVIDARFAKFRAAPNSLVPIKIYDTIKDCWETSITHRCGSYEIVYEIGIAATPHGFDPDHNVICAPGIHFFNTMVAAFFYTTTRRKEDVEFEDGGDIRKVQFTSADSSLDSFLKRHGILTPRFSENSNHK